LKKFFAQPIMLAAIALALAILTLTTVWTDNARAHHGFQGRYDSSRLMYLQGTVQEARWQSPHSVLVVQVPDRISIPDSVRQSTQLNQLGRNAVQRLTIPQNLLGRVQQVEFPPVGSMTRPLRDRLRSGGQIRLLVYRNCDRPHQLRVQFAQMTDGTTVVRPGTVQTEVIGCGR
jgi:hypothetical protein